MEIVWNDGDFIEFLSKNFKNMLAVCGSKQTMKIVERKNTIYIKCYIERLTFTKRIYNIVLYYILEDLENHVDALKTIKELVHIYGINIYVYNCMFVHRYVVVKMVLLKKMDSLDYTDKKLGNRGVYSPELLKKQVENEGLKVIEFRLKPKTLYNKQIKYNWRFNN